MDCDATIARSPFITVYTMQTSFVLADSKPAMSPMWGVHGELFHPQGKLRDWSRAGYGAGDRPIPRPASFSDLVVDWDAAGDGVIDDTEARCQHAIMFACGSGLLLHVDLCI